MFKNKEQTHFSCFGHWQPKSLEVNFPLSNDAKQLIFQLENLFVFYYCFKRYKVAVALHELIWISLKEAWSRCYFCITFLSCQISFFFLKLIMVGAVSFKIHRVMLVTNNGSGVKKKLCLFFNQFHILKIN